MAKSGCSDCTDCTDCRSQKVEGYPLSNPEDYLLVSKASFSCNHSCQFLEKNVDGPIPPAAENTNGVKVPHLNLLNALVVSLFHVACTPL